MAGVRLHEAVFEQKRSKKGRKMIPETEVLSKISRSSRS